MKYIKSYVLNHLWTKINRQFKQVVMKILHGKKYKNIICANSTSKTLAEQWITMQNITKKLIGLNKSANSENKLQIKRKINLESFVLIVQYFISHLLLDKNVILYKANVLHSFLCSKDIELVPGPQVQLQLKNHSFSHS